MAEELIGEPQIVVQGQDCDSLETNHDDLKRTQCTQAFKPVETDTPKMIRMVFQ